MGFDFADRFGCQVKIINDAAMQALEPDYVVVGGGNARRLDDPPPRVHPGENANAFKGGFRLWQEADGKTTAEATTPQKGV